MTSIDVNMALLLQKSTIVPAKENGKISNQRSLFSCDYVRKFNSYKCPLP